VTFKPFKINKKKMRDVGEEGLKKISGPKRAETFRNTEKTA